MVKLTIFNEKGGVGKTTLTAMFASFLAYCHGKKVCVIDFDHPSYHMIELRRDEIRILSDPRSPLSIYLASVRSPKTPYDIFQVTPGQGGSFDPREVVKCIEDLIPSGYDYILYDFPGRFSRDEPVSYLAFIGLIDFLAIPMDTDVQSRRSALVVADAFQSRGIPLVLFWNRVSVYEAKGSGKRFQMGALPFTSRGMDVMEESLRDIRKISRDPSEMAFIRSTLCFPVRYVNQWSPAIIPFFEALFGRIDRATSSPKPQ